MDTVYVALVSGGFSLAGIIVSNLITNAVVKYRVGELEKKVDKHNNVIERVFKLEQKVEDMDNE